MKPKSSECPPELIKPLRAAAETLTSTRQIDLALLCRKAADQLEAMSRICVEMERHLSEMCATLEKRLSAESERREG